MAKREKKKTVELEPDLLLDEKENSSHQASLERLIRQVIRNQKLMLIELKRLK